LANQFGALICRCDWTASEAQRYWRHATMDVILCTAKNVNLMKLTTYNFLRREFFSYAYY